MTSYAGRHAELYDLFYREKPYEAEAAFIEACLARFSDGSSSRILDLACGTGEHAFALEKLGHTVEALDHSADMLDQARRKADVRGSRAVFRLGDVCALTAPTQPFDAATCLFDSIGYVVTNERLRRVFEGVHATLRPGGLFVFEFWHAAAMLRFHEPLRVRRFQTPRGEVLRISETDLNPSLQTATVQYQVYELGSEGTYSSFCETQTNRYFLVQEMAAWLSSSGFTALKWYAGFGEDEDIREETWHIVAVARR